MAFIVFPGSVCLCLRLARFPNAIDLDGQDGVALFM